MSELIRERLAWCRATLERTARHIDEWQGALSSAESSLPRASKERLRDDLITLQRAALDCLRPVALFHGYRFGYQARSQVDNELQQAAEAVFAPVDETGFLGGEAKLSARLVAIARVLVVAADAICTVAVWDDFNAEAGVTAPTKPGPDITAEKAVTHALGLEYRLAGSLALSFQSAQAPLMEKRARAWQQLVSGEQAEFQASRSRETSPND